LVGALYGESTGAIYSLRLEWSGMPGGASLKKKDVALMCDALEPQPPVAGINEVK